MSLYSGALRNSHVHYASHLNYAATQAEAAGRPTLISLNALMRHRPPEPRWIIRGLLPEDVTTLSGGQYSGKTSLALSLAMSVSLGSLALAHFPSMQGSVLYLALEESELRMKEKVTRLLQTHPIPQNFTLALRWPALDKGGLADLEDTIEEYYEQTPLRLVVIDPLHMIQPAHTTFGKPVSRHGAYAATDTFFLPLQEMTRRYHLAIILVHHQPEAKTLPTACRMILTREAEQGRTILHIAGQCMEERKVRITVDPLTSL